MRWKNLIRITITEELVSDYLGWDTKLKDVPNKTSGYRFNYEQAHLLSVYRDWEYCSINIILENKELPRCYEGECVQQFTVEDARKKFPYIFANTNPLLYRKFRRGRIW